MQLAHLAGAFVYGTSRHASKLEKIRDFGLDEGFVTSTPPGKFVDALHQATNGVGADLIIDLVGGAYFPANLRALAMRGRLVCVGTIAGPSSEIDLSVLLRKRATIVGTMLRSRSIEEKAEVIRGFASHVLPLFAAGDLRPVLDRVFPAVDVRAAHVYVETNHSVGKVVLEFPQD